MFSRGEHYMTDYVTLKTHINVSGCRAYVELFVSPRAPDTEVKAAATLLRKIAEDLESEVK